jgi:hypothetical protein
MPRADWAHAGIVAVALFALYAASAPRTVALEDDGLFVLASYYLGVAHPPGYPLFTLFGKLATLVPIGSVAYRVHLLSALLGALSCALAWLCARVLAPGRLSAYLAAFALGVSPVFWSQAIIAEVYTLNTLFFLLLTLLALRSGSLPWMAFIFGSSLANHWPLMLLAAPAFAVLLWPRRSEMLRRLPLLAALAALGLLPYLWMVIASWGWRPISFHGPLESIAEVWYVISRAGYAGTDWSASAGWLDRMLFVRFLAGQLVLQFALLGTLVAAIGFAVQRRLLGTRLAWFFSLAFLMPTVVLAFLLGFDYDAASTHVFHVYPLPAYAVAALWIALGFAWLSERYQLSRRRAVAAASALIVLVFALGIRTNVLTDHEWGARYAQTVLRMLPPDAVLFVRGDADLATIAYFYLVEGWRPDVEIYHTGGKVLGNRLVHPLRTSEAEVDRVLAQFITDKQVPIGFTMDYYDGYARRERWLYSEVDKSSMQRDALIVDIPEEAVKFFEESVAEAHHRNAWIAFHQDELRRRYAMLLARKEASDVHTGRHLAMLSKDYFGALGLAEGLMSGKGGYSAAKVSELLERAGHLMPSGATKWHKSRFFYLRAALRLDLGDKAGARRDFQAALDVWPVAHNRAGSALKDLAVLAP